MNFNIEDKIAVITGASDGIGKAIAFSLAKEGAKVAISARGREKLEKTAEEIRSNTNSDVFAFSADMSKKSEVKKFFESVTAKWGTIHILVNNVGGSCKAFFHELSDEDLQAVMTRNFYSVTFCTREALNHMRQQKWGRIINIGAISGKEPPSGLIASNAAKSSLLSFSKTLASEVAADGVLVNCVCPGRILSSQTNRIHTAEEITSIAKTIPLGRFGNPEEVANLVVFLASEPASYITGTAIPADGGFGKSLY